MNWPVCDKCGQQVTTLDGVIDIDKQEVDNVETARAAWEQAHPDPLLSVTEILEMPSAAKWQWGHLNCVTGDMYQITADRFDELGKALDWTLHLMEKGWLKHTDWRELVRRCHEVPKA